MNSRLIKIAAAVTVAAAVALGGAAWAIAGGGDDDGPGASGPGAAKAKAAALARLGGGTANQVERDSENGAVWEVEVTTTDGTTVDVRLAGSYGVVAVEGDSETNDDQNESGDN